MKRVVLKAIALAVAISPFFAVSLFGQDKSPGPKVPDKAAKAEIEHCMTCHSKEAETGPVVDLSHFDKSPHADLACTSCHTSITADEHTPEMLKDKATCSSCHSDQDEAYTVSVHSRKDKVAGDHPTCLTCHSDGNPHGIAQLATLTRRARVNLCGDCHANEARMTRYNVESEATESYKASFHGKALLAFGNEHTAVCTDCHKFHDVRSPKDPLASTSDKNAAATCGQVGCHPGASKNMAVSGAAHMHLRVHQVPLLGGIEIFFRVLTVGTLAFLVGGVAFDLRRSVLAPTPPPAGRVVATAVGVAFLMLIAAIILAMIGNAVGRGLAVASVVIMAGAILANLITGRQKPKPESQPTYQRFPLSLRIQHVLLALSFMTLVVTGMPVRHPNDEILRHFYLALGGMPVMRVAHRTAACVMITVWIIHSIELLFKWKKAKFSLSSWTMFPTLQDAKDLIHTMSYHMGLSKTEPQFGRFQFREKFDYLAVYWGMPVMVISGLILWFPVYYGSRLPELGIPIAYIAHSDEAVLAFLTIITWHFYNTHFNPRSFPMNSVWITGKMTREEMEREHPLELKEIEGREKE